MRSKGTSNYSGNFEVKFVEPIDARGRVQLMSDLTNQSVWTSSDGSIYLYDGMITAVYGDPIIDNNGIYRLKSAAGYSNLSSWEKLGSGSGHIILDSTSTPVPRRTNLKFSNSSVIDDQASDTTTVIGIKGDTGERGANGYNGRDGSDGQNFLPDYRGALTDSVVLEGEALGVSDNYYFVLVDPNGDLRSDPLVIAPSLVGDKGGHLVAYNGTLWIDYGQLVGVKGDTGDTGQDGNDGYTPIKGVDYFDGEKGDTGLTGLNYLGQHSNSTTYSFRDAVRATGNETHSGNVYYCAIPSISPSDNKLPGVSEDWVLLIEKGQQGSQGIQGEKGEDGADGVGELILPPFYIYLPVGKSFGRYNGTGSQYQITAIPETGWTASQFLRHVAFESSNPTVSITNNTAQLQYNQTSVVSINLSINYSITTPGATLSSSKLEFSRDGSTWINKGSLTFVGNSATYTESVDISSNNTSDIKYKVTITDSNSMSAISNTSMSFPGFIQPALSTTPISQSNYDYGNVLLASTAFTVARQTANTSMVSCSLYVELNSSGSKTKYGETISIVNTPSIATSYSTNVALTSAGEIVYSGSVIAIPNIMTASSIKVYLRIESDIIGSTNTSIDLLVFTRTFSYKIYYGGSTLSSIPVSNTDLLTLLTSFTSISSSTAARDYIFPAISNSYKWICIENLVSTPSSYKNKDTGFAVSMESPILRTYTNGYGVSSQYKFIRTTNATSAALTITAI